LNVRWGTVAAPFHDNYWEWLSCFSELFDCSATSRSSVRKFRLSICHFLIGPKVIRLQPHESRPENVVAARRYRMFHNRWMSNIPRHFRGLTARNWPCWSSQF
jgi:hypothetical protein